MPLKRGSGLRAYGGSLTGTAAQSTGKNYGSLSTGKWRHEYVQNTPAFGVPTALTLGNYFLSLNAYFMRTSTAVADTPPVPTVSNNLGNPLVMNGSRISQFRKTIRLKNTSATNSPTIDIYQVALSYYDALIWDTMRTAECPVTFTNTGGVYDGAVNPKIPAIGVLSANDTANFKFQQHYLKHVKTVTLGNTDGDNVVEFTMSKIPPKCIRSQTGMFWATIFVYDTNKNTPASTANIEYSEATSFMETPSEQRLPFIE